MQLDEDQKAALKLMKSGRNVFLTGEAGTGKSTILREFRKTCGPRCVFLAPTGIAAINVNGSTIHSFFMLKPGLLTPETMDEVGNDKREKLIRATQTIIIDEISMVRSDVFAAIDIRLRTLATGSNCYKPFGGKQIILVGDFFQLPPVVKTDAENGYLTTNLGGWYVFQTRLWQDAHFHCICLKTAHRQQGDSLFLNVLNAIRHGRLTEQDINLAGEMLSPVEILNRFCLNNKSQTMTPVNLCTTNRETATINTMMKSRLQGDTSMFNAVITGKFKESDYPTEAMLEIKSGARVMILCNKHLPNGDFEFVNGDLGTVTEVYSDDPPAVAVKLDKGPTVPVVPNKWVNYDYVFEEDKISRNKVIRQREIGTFYQMPLKLAYAVTIHKAQGLSLDCVNLRLGPGCFAHGQLYTALSRCRSIQGLRIDRPVMPEDLILDQDVVEFYDSIAEITKPSATVSMNIPKEHEAAVRAFLAQLQTGQVSTDNLASSLSALTALPAASSTPTTKLQPTTAKTALPTPGITPPSPKQNFRPTPPPPNDSDDDLDEEDKIYKHIDLVHLMIVYAGQTQREKSAGITQAENGLGFNMIDAPILTELAQKYRNRGFVTCQELAEIHRRIQKYHKQWE